MAKAMTKSQIVDGVAKAADVNKKQAKAAVEGASSPLTLNRM